MIHNLKELHDEEEEISSREVEAKFAVGFGAQGQITALATSTALRKQATAIGPKRGVRGRQGK